MVHFHIDLVHAFISWIILTVSLTLAAWIVPGVSIRGGIVSHFVVAAAFAFVAWLVHVLVLLFFGGQGVAVEYGLGLIARTLALAAMIQVTSMLTQRLHVKTFIRAIFMAIAVSFTTFFVEYAFGHTLARWLAV
jgi:uncharacterized membrane protein YvlD (DUF360 family)